VGWLDTVLGVIFALLSFMVVGIGILATVAADFAVRQTYPALARGWSDVAHLRGRQTLRDLALLFARGGIREALPLLGNPEALGRRVFRIVVKPFMDAHTYDHQRIRQCCTKILDERGEAVSFCEFNVFHRGRPVQDAPIPLTVLG
jgi:hypothetical protein